MSRDPSHFALQIAEDTRTGKKRILFCIYKDDLVDVQRVFTAEECESLAGKLLEVAQELRGKQVIIPS